MQLNKYFDKIYILNLHKRTERKILSQKRFDFVGLECEVFNGVDGSVLQYIHKKIDNPIFANGAYIGCAISHLSIYQEAIEKQYERILIIEDDCRINRNIDSIFSKIEKEIPSDWNNLLYFGYIPLSDDCTRWDYSVFSQNYISSNVFVAKNLWGLYAYGIHLNLMTRLVAEYNVSFPMELDRYFTSVIQPEGKSYGISPQLFCAEDGNSDNSGRMEMGMIERSVDVRFAKYTDYL